MMLKEQNKGTRCKEHSGNLEKDYICPMCSNTATSPEGEIKGYPFRCCLRCQFVFCPKVTPEYLGQLYTQGFHGPEDGAPKNGWSGNPSFLGPAFDIVQKEDLVILDFGTGQDIVPDQLREEGYKVVAVDIAPPLRPHPDRLTGDLIQLKLRPNQFDLIFSFQVFEHLPQPRPLLDELVRLAKPGGLVLIHTDMETPERDGQGFRNWWYAAPPDHCCFYRHKTFQVYLEDKPHRLVWKSPKSVIIKKNGSLVT
ncbi:MAG: class I SAM-dependent methyltransferase [Balneolales bacterium]